VHDEEPADETKPRAADPNPLNLSAACEPVGVGQLPFPDQRCRRKVAILRVSRDVRASELCVVVVVTNEYALRKDTPQATRSQIRSHNSQHFRNYCSASKNSSTSKMYQWCTPGAILNTLGAGSTADRMPTKTHTNTIHKQLKPTNVQTFVSHSAPLASQPLHLSVGFLKTAAYGSVCCLPAFLEEQPPFGTGVSEAACNLISLTIFQATGSQGLLNRPSHHLPTRATESNHRLLGAAILGWCSKAPNYHHEESKSRAPTTDKAVDRM
jgi:hypothetical protein